MKNNGLKQTVYYSFWNSSVKSFLYKVHIICSKCPRLAEAHAFRRWKLLIALLIVVCCNSYHYFACNFKKYSGWHFRALVRGTTQHGIQFQWKIFLGSEKTNSALLTNMYWKAHLMSPNLFYMMMMMMMMMMTTFALSVDIYMHSWCCNCLLSINMQLVLCSYICFAILL